MSDPITPDERAAIRESAESWDDVHPDDALRLLDALDTAEAEVARLLAERTAAHADDATCASCTHEYVADMERRVEEAEAARPAPVWDDEDTVTEAVARALRDAGLVEVVAVHEGYGAEEVVHSHLRPVVNAVLALWPGESRATVQAEALRDAANAAIAQDNTQGDWWDDDQQTYGTPVDWLRARADRLGAEGGDDRG